MTQFDDSSLSRNKMLEIMQSEQGWKVVTGESYDRNWNRDYCYIFAASDSYVLCCRFLKKHSVEAVDVIFGTELDFDRLGPNLRDFCHKLQKKDLRFDLDIDIVRVKDLKSVELFSNAIHVMDVHSLASEHKLRLSVLGFTYFPVEALNGAKSILKEMKSQGKFNCEFSEKEGHSGCLILAFALTIGAASVANLAIAFSTELFQL